MAKKAAIPLDTREWPDYEYRAFPKWVGRDEFGQDLVANSEEEVATLEKRKVYPQDIGYDRMGNLVQILHPDEASIKKTWVVRPMQPVENNLTSAEDKSDKSDKGGKKKAA